MSIIERIANLESDDLVGQVAPNTAVLIGGVLPSDGTLRPFTTFVDADGNYLCGTYSGQGREHSASIGRMFSCQVEVNAPSFMHSNPLLLIKNPLASNKRLVFQKIRVTSLDFDQYSIFRIYANPTITGNGSPATILNRLINNSPPLPVGQVFTLPSLSSFGIPISTFMIGEPQVNGSTSEVFLGGDLIVSPGNSIAVYCKPEKNNSIQSMFFMWSEEAN